MCTDMHTDSGTDTRRPRHTETNTETQTRRAQTDSHRHRHTQTWTDTHTHVQVSVLHFYEARQAGLVEALACECDLIFYTCMHALKENCCYSCAWLERLSAPSSTSSSFLSVSSSSLREVCCGPYLSGHLSNISAPFRCAKLQHYFQHYGV